MSWRAERLYAVLKLIAEVCFMLRICVDVLGNTLVLHYSCLN